MIKVIVTGALGRMGKEISRLVLKQEGMMLSGATERAGHSDIGKDLGVLLGEEKTGVTLGDSLEKIISAGEVIIDFTSPKSTLEHLALAVKNKKALVVGTTGLSEGDIAKIKTAAGNISCVFSPNMSIGVNLLFKTAGEVARALGDDYDVEIVETHHRHKKDAPSGTAKKLAEIIAQALGRDLAKVAVYGREGITGERPRDVIGIHSVRGGDTVGDHTVIFSGGAERIELTHRATSRSAFAEGALRAARFVAKVSPGLYTMQDVLKKG